MTPVTPESHDFRGPRLAAGREMGRGAERDGAKEPLFQLTHGGLRRQSKVCKSGHAN